ncbi:hypothetical protein IW261DRAFT_1575166 [Armillaria novae-zelandiae]|uniref:Uncharacterized protein n=1 Tax=Armillaria novae-zelandiae TaxID=153914 RepID=A0AA39NFP8_9AGAR|nr:hypothetical protein IW261DRAFT_1575166 [Armillaria novae-zelandiae]
MANASRWSQTLEPYEAHTTPDDLDVDELPAFYAGRDAREEAHWSAVEAHELWLSEKLKAKKAAVMNLNFHGNGKSKLKEALRKRSLEREKKLQELKLKKEVEAAERWAEEARVAREAEEQKIAAEKKAAEKRKAEAAAMEAKRKRLAAMESEATRMRRLLREQTELAKKAAAAAAQAAKGDDEGAKRKEKGKGKASLAGAMGPSNKWKRLMRSVVEDSEDASEERLAKKSKGKAVERGEFHRADKCGWCWADGAHCIMSSTMWSCEQCRIRKAKCLWMEEAELSALEEVLDLLHGLHARFDDMEEQMEKMELELESIGGHVDDLVHNFKEGSAGEYPRDFIPAASVDEWEALLEELKRFCETRTEFYCLGGLQIEWVLWKEYLKGGEDFLVEDSEGELDESEVARPEMLPESVAEGVPGMAEWMKKLKGKGKEVDSGEASGSADA